MRPPMQKNEALLIVDLQNDFCEGGALPVPDATSVITIANKLMPRFKTVIATQDWHPKNHDSFREMWPVHCVQHSLGAAFHPQLNQKNITHIVKKGTDPLIDSYSAFYDNNHQKSTGLTAYLQINQITHLVVMGLATDYCVKYTCLDAIADGFSVEVLLEGCRGIEKHGIEKAIKEMQAVGVVINTDEIL